MFFWLTVIGTAVLIAPAVMLLPVGYRIRRRHPGNRDFANVYRLLIFYIVYVVVRAVVLVSWPQQPSEMAVVLSALPVLVICVGFGAVRVYRTPEILFSDRAIARWRAFTARRRP